MILVKILFFKVFFAIVNDSRIGTPALFNDDNVLDDEGYDQNDMDREDEGLDDNDDDGNYRED